MDEGGVEQYEGYMRVFAPATYVGGELEEQETNFYNLRQPELLLDTFVGDTVLITPEGANYNPDLAALRQDRTYFVTARNRRVPEDEEEIRHFIMFEDDPADNLPGFRRYMAETEARYDQYDGEDKPTFWSSFLLRGVRNEQGVTVYLLVAANLSSDRRVWDEARANARYDVDHNRYAVNPFNLADEDSRNYFANYVINVANAEFQPHRRQRTQTPDRIAFIWLWIATARPLPTVEAAREAIRQLAEQQQQQQQQRIIDMAERANQDWQRRRVELGTMLEKNRARTAEIVAIQEETFPAKMLAIVVALPIVFGATVGILAGIVRLAR